MDVKQIHAILNLVGFPETNIHWWAACWINDHLAGLIPCTPEILQTPQTALQQLICAEITFIRFQHGRAAATLEDFEILLQLREICANLEPPTPEDDPGPWSLNLRDLIIIGERGDFISVTEYTKTILHANNA